MTTRNFFHNGSRSTPLCAIVVVAAALALLPSAGRAETPELPLQGYSWQAPTFVRHAPPPEWRPPMELTPPAASALPPQQLRKPTFLERITGGIKSLGRGAERTHDRLQDSILEQTVRLDDFFGTVNSKKAQQTSYQLRWRNSVQFKEGEGVKLGSTVRADVQLSRIDERLRLSISGENEPDSFGPRLPEDPGNPGFDRTFQNARIVNTELRYHLIRSQATSGFIGTGLDLHFPLQLFARARFQHSHRLSDIVLLRFAETVFARTSDGVGETTELSLERSLDPKTLLRLANSGTVAQEVGGLEWGSELSLLHALSPKSAVTLAAGVYGGDDESSRVSDYRLFLRYRRNFLEKWLFYEVEPEISWPRRDDGSFPTTYALSFRLEVVFEGKEKRGTDGR